jgi:hypothetical protein
MSFSTGAKAGTDVGFAAQAILAILGIRPLIVHGRKRQKKDGEKKRKNLSSLRLLVYEPYTVARD